MAEALTLQELEKIATIIAAFAGVALLGLISWQVNEATRQRRLQATLEVFKILGPETARSDRRLIFQ